MGSRRLLRHYPHRDMSGRSSRSRPPTNCSPSPPKRFAPWRDGRTGLLLPPNQGAIMSTANQSPLYVHLSLPRRKPARHRMCARSWPRHMMLSRSGVLLGSAWVRTGKRTLTNWFVVMSSLARSWRGSKNPVRPADYGAVHLRLWLMHSEPIFSVAHGFLG